MPYWVRIIMMLIGCISTILDVDYLLRADTHISEEMLNSLIMVFKNIQDHALCIVRMS